MHAIIIHLEVKMGGCRIINDYAIIIINKPQKGHFPQVLHWWVTLIQMMDEKQTDSVILYKMWPSLMFLLSVPSLSLCLLSLCVFLSLFIMCLSLIFHYVSLSPLCVCFSLPLFLSFSLYVFYMCLFLSFSVFFYVSFSFFYLSFSIHMPVFLLLSLPPSFSFILNPFDIVNRMLLQARH